MKFAILGGGVGAMTAAYWLTNPSPDGHTPEHEVTVYQMGWRLGGKGASGRNIPEGSRIEEHGLHIWMGSYANAFRMMRAVYGELNRPAGSRLATWRDAFKPQSVYNLMEERGDRWMSREWIFPFPVVPGSPGDQTGYPAPCGYLPALAHTLVHRVERFLGGYDHEDSRTHDIADQHRTHLAVIHKLAGAAAVHAGTPHEAGTPGPGNPLPHDHLGLRLALEALQLAIGVGFEICGDCVDFQRLLITLDAGVAIELGILSDLCETRDWTVIDDLEWRTWLKKHGMHKETEHSAPIRSLYDLLFAFKDGKARDWEAADLAAGTATCMALRMCFDYYEGLFMRMQASMGETIFTPLYEVLRRRGVKFRFFHRLREVVPSDDGTAIDGLRIGVQATTYGGQDYRPLFRCKGVDCWPSAAFYDQLQQGAELEELQARGFNLEDYDAPWPDVEELYLERGKDFDVAVFGLALGAVPHVCSRIVEQKPAWRAMVDNVRVVETLAFQFWFLHNIAELGWPPALDGRNYGEFGILSSFAEPADTCADMSLLIPIEDWDVPVKNISYFCGPLRTGSTLDTVRGIARGFLANDAGVLWTESLDRAGNFHLDWLAINDPPPDATDEERFARQFFRINNQPTEKYVMSVSGSTKYRLDPAETGYVNLVLAGDWVRNGLALGCVESGVLGAMKGVQKYCPSMVIVE